MANNPSCRDDLIIIDIDERDLEEIRLPIISSYISCEIVLGHATAEMLTKVYAAIVDEDRVNNAIIMEERLFSKLDNKHND